MVSQARRVLWPSTGKRNGPVHCQNETKLTIPSYMSCFAFLFLGTSMGVRQLVFSLLLSQSTRKSLFVNVRDCLGYNKFVTLPAKSSLILP